MPRRSLPIELASGPTPNGRLVFSKKFAMSRECHIRWIGYSNKEIKSAFGLPDFFVEDFRVCHKNSTNSA